MPRRGGGGSRSRSSGGGLFGSKKSSSSGGLFGRRKPAAAPARRAAPAPAQRSSSTAPATTGGGGMMSGIGSTIVQGMAFGTGSAIAHRAVGAVANSFSGSDEHKGEAATAPATAGAESGANAWGSSAPAPAVDCSGFMSALNTCFSKYPGDISMCQEPMNMFKECKEGGMTSTSSGMTNY